MSRIKLNPTAHIGKTDFELHFNAFSILLLSCCCVSKNGITESDYNDYNILDGAKEFFLKFKKRYENEIKDNANLLINDDSFKHMFERIEGQDREALYFSDEDCKLVLGKLKSQFILMSVNYKTWLWFFACGSLGVAILYLFYLLLSHFAHSEMPYFEGKIIFALAVIAAGMMSVTKRLAETRPRKLLERCHKKYFLLQALSKEIETSDMEKLLRQDLDGFDRM